MGSLHSHSAVLGGWLTRTELLSKPIFFSELFAFLFCFLLLICPTVLIFLFEFWMRINEFCS